MKKLLAILAGGALIVLLAACDISSFLKPKGGQQTQQQPSENPPPDTAPPPAQPPATEPPTQAVPPPTQPATPPAQPKTQPATPPPQTHYQEPPASNYPPPSNQQGTNPNYPPPANQGGYNQPSGSNSGYGQQSNYPQGKVKKGGLGVIFTGNLPQGQFRVKVDQELVYELAFSGTETRATKELLVEPGQHMIRFAVIDANGVRGLKEETFMIKPGAHQTVRVSVKDTPGAIIVEHLE